MPRWLVRDAVMCVQARTNPNAVAPRMANLAEEAFELGSLVIEAIIKTNRDQDTKRGARQIGYSGEGGYNILYTISASDENVNRMKKRKASPIRDQQKEARRLAILSAAEALIRERGDVHFSMLELATGAGVSLATPYNLFGTKSAILYALLNQSADRIFTNAEPDPKGGLAAQTLASAASLAEVLSGDPAFYRPLYAFLMGVPNAMWRPAFTARSRQYWARPFAEADDFLVMPVSTDIVTDLLVVQALGCVEMWVHREIDDLSLGIELRRACAAVLLGLVAEPEQPLLRKAVAAPRTNYGGPSAPVAATGDQSAASAEKKRRASA